MTKKFEIGTGMEAYAIIETIAKKDEYEILEKGFETAEEAIDAAEKWFKLKVRNERGYLKLDPVIEAVKVSGLTGDDSNELFEAIFPCGIGLDPDHTVEYLSTWDKERLDREVSAE